MVYLNVLTSLVNNKKLIGKIVVHDSNITKQGNNKQFSFEKILPSKNKRYLEVIATKQKWVEGPVFLESPDETILLFSDTVLNRIYRYEEGKGLLAVGKTIFAEFTGCKLENKEYCDRMKEPGSNAIIKYKDTNNLLVCQHGERAISFFRENGTRSFIATHYKEKKFNSPNDLILSSDGNLYFTDPHYGLYNSDNLYLKDLKELDFNGVLMILQKDLQTAISTGVPTKNTIVLIKTMSMPNGLAFSPDYYNLYISNSDKNNAYWKVYDVAENGLLKNGKIFHNVTHLTSISNNDDVDYADGIAGVGIDVSGLTVPSTENELVERNDVVENSILDLTEEPSQIGLPDGMTVDIYGNIYASGPGGVYVFNSNGTIIGQFLLDHIVSNVALDSKGSLVFTASDIVTRIKLNTKNGYKIK